jgi:hypothetical protein
MDLAVEMDMAKFVGADIEICTVRVIAVMGMSVRRRDYALPSGNRLRDAARRACETRGWLKRPFGSERYRVVHRRHASRSKTASDL